MHFCIYFCFTALFNQVIVTEVEYALRTHFTGILTNIVRVCTVCSVLFTRCLESSCCNLAMQLSQIPLYVRALLKYCFIVVTFTVQFRLQSVCDLWHLCQLSVYTNELQFC